MLIFVCVFSDKLSSAAVSLISVANSNKNNASKIDVPQTPKSRANHKACVLQSFQTLLPDHKKSSVWGYCINVVQFCFMISAFPRLMASFTVETGDIFENSPLSSSVFEHDAISSATVVVKKDGKVDINFGILASFSSSIFFRR